MRVAILNPMFGKDFTKSARWFARSRGRVQRHPDYLATCAAVVEAAGHEIFFMDCQAKNLPTQVVIDEHLKAFRPDMTVYQATTPSIYADIESARLCKEAYGGLHVMVGPHVSAEPESTLRAAGGALDAVVRHEFDYTVRDLANGASIKDCLGLSYLDGEDYVENADRPYIENLDDLPFPAWHHLDMHDYRDGAKLFPFVTAITARGCRYRCSYCQIPQVMNGHGYRPHSVERVVDEMVYDQRIIPGLREVMFEDDTLTMRIARDRLIALCEEIIRRVRGSADPEQHEEGDDGRSDVHLRRERGEGEDPDSRLLHDRRSGRDPGNGAQDDQDVAGTADRHGAVHGGGCVPGYDLLRLGEEERGVDPGGLAGLGDGRLRAGGDGKPADVAAGRDRQAGRPWASKFLSASTADVAHAVEHQLDGGCAGEDAWVGVFCGLFYE